ncbi:MAG: erythromycin esterase family protein [Sphingorhabdus sp.]
MLNRIVISVLTPLALVFSISVALGKPNDKAMIGIKGDQALDLAVRDMCKKDIAMLGEAAHGDSQTEAFKIQLIERLVVQCGYDALFFEASFAEFIPIARSQRNGTPVTRERIAAAVGGLWKFDREFQPLLPFLTEMVNRQKMYVGGIDHQIGGMGQDYANVGAVADLSANLPPEVADGCKRLVRNHIYQGFSAERTTETRRCIDAMQAALEFGEGIENAEKRMLLANLEVALTSDFSAHRSAHIAKRDRQMYANFQWLKQRLKPGSKIMIWSATVHIADGADEAANFSGVANLGHYIKRNYGKRAFALGFSALAGTRRSGRESLRLPEAPLNSLEIRMLQNSSADRQYIDKRQLRKIGEAPSAAFGNGFQNAAWWQRLDALVVFREEHSAHSVQAGR